MSVEFRLPIVNGDDGTWGDIIRQYIKKEHYDDGTDNATDNGGHQKVTIRAGTTAAGTAPLKFHSGSLMTTPETGAVEFNSDNLYFTITTGTTRKKVAIYDDTSGATGDLYYRDSSGNLIPLGATSNGQILKLAGGVPSWAAGNSTLPVSPTKTTDYLITSSDTVIFADATSANVTITLPSASSFSGYRFYIKRIDGTAAHTVTVSRTSSDTIDGMINFTLDMQYSAIAVVSNGSNWYIL